MSTCKEIDTTRNDLRVAPENGGWEAWNIITWDAALKWPTGEEFAVQDFYRKRKNEVFRAYSYHFMDGQKKCIFRFDTHGELIPLGKACHMHLGGGEEVLEEGDNKLRGFRLVEMDFLRAHTLIYKHLNGKKMPWDR
jgi:hypothetical protein